MGEEDVIERIRVGEQGAYAQLVRTYQSLVYRAVYGVLHDATWAEEVSAQAFVRAYYALPHYQGHGFKTWLLRIAVNLAIDEKRKEERQVRLALLLQGEPETLHPFSASPEQQVIAMEEQEELQARLAKIPAGYREVLSLFYFEEKSYQEIAAELDVTVKTVETKLYRARQWVRQHWRREEWR